MRTGEVKAKQSTASDIMHVAIFMGYAFIQRLNNQNTGKRFNPVHVQLVHDQGRGFVGQQSTIPV